MAPDRPCRWVFGERPAAAGTAAARGRSVPGGPGGSAARASADDVIWLQEQITLPARPRGFHLVTREVVHGLRGLEQIGVGVLHLLIQHTSASLALNENASPDVRRDFETWFNVVVPEAAPFWTHT